jgi:hypothetical protein
MLHMNTRHLRMSYNHQNVNAEVRMSSQLKIPDWTYEPQLSLSSAPVT